MSDNSKTPLTPAAPGRHDRHASAADNVDDLYRKAIAKEGVRRSVSLRMGLLGTDYVSCVRPFFRCPVATTARDYLVCMDPDFFPLAPCGTEWSQSQRINQDAPLQVRTLRRRRKQLQLLGFTDEVAQWQHRQGLHPSADRTAWFIENPRSSLA